MFFKRKKSKSQSDRATAAEPTTAEQFWAWFQSAGLLDVESREFGKIVNPRLKAINEYLTWEVGPETQRPREFIVSADGIPEGADAVEALCDAAPKDLEGWKITRFRPRVGSFGRDQIQIGETVVSVGDIRFGLLDESPLVGIVLFVDYPENPLPPLVDQACFLLLDSALGEYDMLTRVGSVNIEHASHCPDNPNIQPLADIREQFDIRAG